MENQILFIAGKKLCCDEFLLTAKIIQKKYQLKTTAKWIRMMIKNEVTVDKEVAVCQIRFRQSEY